MSRKVIFEFDPFEIAGVDEPNPKTKKKVLQDCADFALVQTFEYMNAQTSPVQGHGRFKKLTKDYKKIKVAQGGAPVPDLFLEGAMQGALKASVKGGMVRLGVNGGKQGDKADGHCNFSGESELPLRRFVPNPEDGETFKKPILDGIRRIVREGQE